MEAPDLYSKSRSLALLGAITQFPAMSTTNVLEQLLRPEELFRKYSQAAGAEVSSELSNKRARTSPRIPMRAVSVVNQVIGATSAG